MKEASRPHQRPTAEPLGTLVPRLVGELADVSAPARFEIDGTVLSADISGFTSLSEQLADRGRRGAEELTELVNTCFGALIATASGLGGDVLKFGGDALLILFRGDRHMARAARAGVEMQHTLRASAPARRHGLSMSVGIAEGPFEVMVVGSRQRDLLVVGRRASEVIRLEWVARRGEVLVTPAVAAARADDEPCGERSGGVLLRVDRPDPPAAPVPPERCEPFVPASVVEQWEAFQSGGGEHRRVSVGFVVLTELDERVARDPSAVLQDLHALVDRVTETSGRLGVTFLHSDVARDGLKLVLVAGAPIGRGDSADAMVRTALDLVAADLAGCLRVGVQSGRVFAGFLGSPDRRTYTIMGDAVNTAARLTATAGDREVVVGDEVLAATRGEFVTRDLGVIALRGKEHGQRAHLVVGGAGLVVAAGDAEPEVSAVPLVGRGAELTRLVEALVSGHGAIELLGPAGIGKSRLIDEALVGWEGTRHRATAVPHDAQTPYALARPVVRSLLGIDPGADAGAAGRRMEEFARSHAPHLLPVLPLLAEAAGAQTAATDTVDAIDPDFRRERTHMAVAALADVAAAHGAGVPVLVLEDVHWADPLSRGLLDHLTVRSHRARWRLVLSRRDGDPVPWVDRIATIELGELPLAELRSLAAAASPQPRTDRQLDELARHASGNPLFALELTRGGDGAALPGSIEDLLGARIDALPPLHRRLVRLASVFGNEAPEDLLAAIAADELSERSPMATGVAGILERTDGGWRFATPLHREAAYEGLTFRERARLHQRIGLAVEAASDDPDAQAELLSWHFHECGDRARTWHYSLVAASRAVARHSPTLAAAALERALDAAARSTSIGARERADVNEQLADALAASGRLDDARRALDRSRRLNTDPTTDLTLLRKIGRLQELSGDLTGALRWYRRGSRAAAAAPVASTRHLAARARVDLQMAGVRFRQRDFRACHELAFAALALAEESGSAEAVALAHDRIHVAGIYLGRDDATAHGERAVELYGELGDFASMARVLNNQGIAAYFAGDWTTASRRYEASAEAGGRSGNIVEASLAGLNSGEILSDQGHWTEAIDRFDAALRNWSAAGYSGVAAALLFRGVARLRLGALDAAAADLEAGLTRMVDAGAEELVAEARSRELELDLHRGVLDRDRLEALRRSHAEGPPAVRLDRLATADALLAGRRDAARTDLERGLAVPDGGAYERALLIEVGVAGGLLDADGDLARERADTLARLGVVRTVAAPSSLAARS